VFAPSHPDLSAVRTVAGDFHEGDLGEVISEGTLVADVVDDGMRACSRIRLVAGSEAWARGREMNLRGIGTPGNLFPSCPV
jgi:hypothetical protein